MDLSRAFDLNRALAHGYQGFQRATGPMFLGAFLIWATGNSSSGFNFNVGDFGDFDRLEKIFSGEEPPSFDWGGDPESAVPPELMDMLMGDNGELAIAAVAGTLLCSLIVLVFFVCLHSWLQVGWLRTHREVVVTGTSDFGPLFSGGDRFLDMILWRLLQSLVATGTAAAAVAPGGLMIAMAFQIEQPILGVLGGITALGLGIPVMVWVGLGLMLGDHALVLEGLSPMEALDRSWSLAKGNRATLFIFGLVVAFLLAIATSLGLLFFCVGAFIAGPVVVAITDMGFTECYLIAVEGEEAATDWVLVRESGGL